MRRNMLLGLVAALALAIGLSNVATADPGASASAKASKKGKRGKGKAKACKAKACKGKRGKKARRSASASAKGKKGGKARGRGRGCKGGGANWVEIGKYAGGDGVEVDIRSRKRIFVTFPQAPATCLFFPSGGEDEDAKVTAKKLTAGFVAEPGQKGFIKRWQLTVYPSYKYKLVIDSSTSDLPGTTPCDKPGATFQGKLSKIG